MGFRYRKSYRLSPGLKVNLTGRGFSSISVGGKGSSLNIGKRGVKQIFSLPGSGLSYSTRRSGGEGEAIFAVLALVLFGLIGSALGGNRLSQATLVVLAGLGFCVYVTSPSHPAQTPAQPTAASIAPLLDTDRSVASTPAFTVSEPTSSSSQVRPSSAVGIATSNAIIPSVSTTPLGPLAAPASLQPSLSGLSVAAPQKVPARTMEVIVFANIRSLPSKAGVVLGQVQVGDVVRVVGFESRWAKVERENHTFAWVHASMLADR